MNAALTALTTDGQWLSALLAGTVFLLSGALKLVYWTRFRDTLSAMGLLPSRLARGVGWVLPPLEVGLGAAVVAQWQLALTGPALLGLLVGFTLALAIYRLRGGKELVCGCFADFEHKTETVPLILRNGLLLVLAAPLLIGPRDAAGRGVSGVAAGRVGGARPDAGVDAAGEIDGGGHAAVCRRA